MHNFQALRQKQQDEDNDIRHQLDRELDTIRNLLSGPDLVSGPVEKDVGSQAFGASGDHDQQYDQFVRELVFDQRSKPKDRTKTEEELALEAKIALEKAERQRIRRMNGEDDDESGESQKSRKRRRPIGGDDLEDDFSGVDDLETLGVGLRSDLDGISEDGHSEHDGSDNGSDTSEDGTSGELDLAPRSGLPCVTDPITSGSEKRARNASTSSNELPYTFPCPSSHEEFLDIVGGLADQDSLTVIERIRTLHHPSLSPENPSKLQVTIEFMIVSTSCLTS